MDEYVPGQRVVLTHQIPQRDQVWTTKIAGTVQRYEQRKTGSWYCHAKDDRLWLDRLTLKKDDGEIVVCNLDNYTHVQVVSAANVGAGGQASSDDGESDVEPTAVGDDQE